MKDVSESIKNRISLVQKAESEEDLKKHMCPFFEKGGFPDCGPCKKTMEDLEECKEVYLERIRLRPMDIWSEEFDAIAILKRDKVVLEDIGVGISCNTCYIYDKCPMYKRDHECAIEWGADKPTTSGGLLDYLTKMQYERVKRASLYEKVDGGVPDVGLSSEIDRLTGLVGMKIDSERDKLSISVTASGKSSDGGGILSKIFGGGGSKPAIEEKKAIAIEEVAESRKDVGEVTDFEMVEEPIKVPRKSRKFENESKEARS